jgi:hypothetical protein
MGGLSPMATSAEKRAWLAANGHPELAEGKGRLPGPLLAEYDAAHAPADDYGPGTEPGDFDGPLDFVAAGDPPPPPGDGEAPGDGAGAAAEEERPPRPHAARPRFGFGGKRRVKGKPSPSTGRKTFRRVSIAPLIEDAYSDIAWAAAGIPPLQRLLYAQAPIAGVVLDPVVRDTVADRVVLQPMARNYERVKVGMALVGTPLALVAVLATAPGIAVDPDTGRPVMAPVLDAETGQPVDGQMVPVMAPPSVQHQSAMLTLRYGVRAMADLAGDSMIRVRERAEENAARDDMVNDFIGFLLGVPVPVDAEETAAREARDAGLRLAGEAE